MEVIMTTNSLTKPPRTERQRQQRKLGLVLLGGAMLFIIGIIVVAAIAPKPYAAFSKNMGIYAQGYNPSQVDQQRSSNDTTTTKSVWASGPVLVIDPGKKAVVDDAQASLPSDRKATSPKNVNLVVWLDRYTYQVSTYENGDPAYRWYADLTFVDPHSGNVLGRTEISGGDPPHSISNSSNKEDATGSMVSGSDVAKSIAEWVAATPTG